MIRNFNGNTRQQKEFFDENLGKLGDIKRVTHKRDGQSVEYETIIEGTEETMLLSGGFSSGYGGEGPNGLVYALTKMGVSNEEARKYAIESSDVSFVIEF
ncbi:hypothetical protein [Paenisporosarcina sp. HGH0030]|uniref:hypothetical protein n=1 Tax=Paenisporosarcina sp. HGH0030 TaxID=1078085 RepID=UPI00039B4688|nr:hypothetical protein [Paenisporosarcina sp. HGH0030]